MVSVGHLGRRGPQIQLINHLTGAKAPERATK
nr:MAG TPA: hypothetical protein [Caudoviricetes sp.]